MVEVAELIIGRLVADLRPVRRLRPPALRAALWLLMVGALAVMAVLAFADLELFIQRTRDPQLTIELAATLVTGIVAVIAAFELSLPDRSSAWAFLPVPSLLLWLASSGYSCYRHWLSFNANGWEIGDSARCFVFILAVSLPLAISLVILLRHAHPLAPLRVAATGGLGVAGIAAFLLQFFHPFDVTFMDLGVHATAVAIVVAVTALAGSRRAG